VVAVVAVVASLSVVASPTADAASGQADAAAESNPACAGNALTEYGFTDVSEGHGHRNAINCLAHHQVSVGTGDGSVYSPDDHVLRWQMALFMLRAADAAGVELPPAVDQGFTDIGSKSQAIRDAVNQLVTAEMSNGHTATEFKPDEKVTRAQMALFVLHFLAKASDRVSVDGDGDVVVRDDGGSAISADDFFTDTTGLSFAANQATIALFELGVANGTAPGVFSPAVPVTRAQMAAFITRALAFTSVQPKATAPRAPVPTTTMPPQPQTTKIRVPNSEPEGICAYAIPKGIYDWEWCAWRDYRSDKKYNYFVSDSKAQSLAQRIWDEVNTPGKPDEPPTMEIVPSGTACASGEAVGCYIRDRHHIRRLDSFNLVLLHDLAHALIADSPEVRACELAFDYNACVHGDLFRCVANHLYVTYAQIPDAGVCGTAPAIDVDDYVTWESGTSSGTDQLTLEPTELHLASLKAVTQDRPWPYLTDPVYLMITCLDQDQLGVLFWLESGFLAGISDSSSPYYNKIPMVYRFGTRTGPIYEPWLESEGYQGAILPQELISAFVDNLLASEGEQIVMRVWNYDGEEFGTFEFVSRGVAHNVEPVLESCRWR